MNTVITPQQRFVARLESFIDKQDRGALAALRRGLGRQPGTVREMDPYILRYIPTGNEFRENAYYLVAALFAEWHQGKDRTQPDAPKDLGGSLRMLVDQETKSTGSRDEAEKRIEKRLVALLNCHRDDLHVHLHHIIGLLNDVPVNWRQLLIDICNWSDERRWVQRNWSRSFWSGYRGETNSAEPETITNEESEEQ